MTKDEKLYAASWRRAVGKVEAAYRRPFREALEKEIDPLLKGWGMFNTPEDVIAAVPVMVRGDGVRRVQAKLYTEEGVEFAFKGWTDLERMRRKADLEPSRSQWTYPWTQMMEEYFTSEAALFISSMMETSRSEVIAIVQSIAANSVKEGLSIYQTMQLLEQRIPVEWRKTTRWRSELIARTEVLTATSYGADMGARSLAEQEGLDLQKKWLVRLDGRERPWHGDMARAGYIDVDKAFDVGGAAMQRPGDPAGGARNRCNCRCTLIRRVVE